MICIAPFNQLQSSCSNKQFVWCKFASSALDFIDQTYFHFLQNKFCFVQVLWNNGGDRNYLFSFEFNILSQVTIFSSKHSVPFSNLRRTYYVKKLEFHKVETNQNCRDIIEVFHIAHFLFNEFFQCISLFNDWNSFSISVSVPHFPKRFVSLGTMSDPLSLNVGTSYCLDRRELSINSWNFLFVV